MPTFKYKMSPFYTSVYRYLNSRICMMFQWCSGWWFVWRKRFWRQSRLFCKLLLAVLYMAELTASLQFSNSSTLGTSTHTLPLIIYLQRSWHLFWLVFMWLRYVCV